MLHEGFYNHHGNSKQEQASGYDDAVHLQFHLFTVSEGFYLLHQDSDYNIADDKRQSNVEYDKQDKTEYN